MTTPDLATAADMLKYPHHLRPAELRGGAAPDDATWFSDLVAKQVGLGVRARPLDELRTGVMDALISALRTDLPEEGLHSVEDALQKAASRMLATVQALLLSIEDIGEEVVRLNCVLEECDRLSAFRRRIAAQSDTHWLDDETLRWICGSGRLIRLQPPLLKMVEKKLESAERSLPDWLKRLQGKIDDTSRGVDRLMADVDRQRPKLRRTARAAARASAQAG